MEKPLQLQPPRLGGMDREEEKEDAGEETSKTSVCRTLHILLYNHWMSDERDFGSFFDFHPRWEFTEADEILTIF